MDTMKLFKSISLILAFFLIQTTFAFGGSTFVLDEITSESLEGNLLGDPATRKLWVYLPPGYETSPDMRYPTLYMLHGYTGNYMYFKEAKFHSCRMGEISDKLLADGLINEMIIVMPDAINAYGGSFYEKSEVMGDYRTYIAQELVTYIDQKFRTIADKKHRAIGGHSMGGYGALSLAMEYHDVFGAVVALGPAFTSFESKPTQADLFIQENPTTIGLPVKDWKTVNIGVVLNTQFSTNLCYAMSAIVAPNKDNPPYYLDLPVKYPEKTIVQSVWDKWLDYDLLHLITRNGKNLSNIPVYINQGVGPVVIMAEPTDIELLPAALNAVGVSCTYEESNGDHLTHLHEQGASALKFLSRKHSAVFPTNRKNLYH
jgi:S-formylglutathione hydrolase FrmB